VSTFIGRLKEESKEVPPGLRRGENLGRSPLVAFLEKRERGSKLTDRGAEKLAEERD